MPSLPLDFHSLKELPESYKWAPLDNPYPTKHGLDPEPIPMIHLDDPNAREQICVACKSWGVFQVTNHGIPMKLLDDMEATTKSLFGLPAQQKLKAARPPNGVDGYGPARISTFFPKRMWSEGFTILGSPLEHARLLWPNDYTKFCDIIDEYKKEMNILAGKLMWLILGSLGVSNIQDMNNWASSQNGPGPTFKGSTGAIQLNSYPACPDPDRAMGLAAHTDSTLLTILHQSGPIGLHVLEKRFGWVPVAPVPGTLVVNVGDLLQILSNGQYPSVYHRAVVNREQDRISIAYLYGPGSKAQIRPILRRSDGKKHRPLYRPVTWSDYLGIKAKYFDKALSLVRININNYDNDNNNNVTNEPIRVDKNRSIKVGFEAKP